MGAKLLTATFVVLFGLQTPACQNCDTSGDPIDYTEGITDPTRTSYESTPLNGEWLHFPPGRTYDLRHNLRDDPNGPLLVQSYVSFKSRLSEGAGSTTENPNNFSESAGNQVVYESTEKPQTIRVRNDTCADFYVRIVAMVAPGTGLQSLGGAGGDASTGGSAGVP